MGVALHRGGVGPAQQFPHRTPIMLPERGVATQITGSMSCQVWRLRAMQERYEPRCASIALLEWGFGMRVLITGHNGYIGSVLAPFVRAAGHDVVGLDTYLFERGTFGHYGPQIDALRMDLRDVQVSDLRGFDAVMHLAA